MCLNLNSFLNLETVHVFLYQLVWKSVLIAKKKWNVETVRLLSNIEYKVTSSL